MSFGANSGRIALDVGGARPVRVARGGALVMRVAGGTVRQLPPVAFQRVDGQRRPVDSRYVVRDGVVGIDVGAYDRGRLVIDPVLAYSTYLGGSDSDAGVGIAVDSERAAYVTGNTASSDYPTRHAFQRTFASPGEDGGLPGNDAFVTKLSPDERSLDYSTYLGGSAEDNSFGDGAIAVDARGAAYVTAATRSRDFPTKNAVQDTNAGFNSAFVAKLSGALPPPPASCHGRPATIVGTAGDDPDLNGTPGDDVIIAGEGDDRVNGGDDVI